MPNASRGTTEGGRLVASFAADLPLLGRLCLAIFFSLSGIGKPAAPEATIAYIASAGRPFAPLGLVIAVAVEIGGSALLALGLFTRLVAAIMAAFCVATAVFFHSELGDQMQFIQFFKNVAITGGFLQVVASARGGAASTLGVPSGVSDFAGSTLYPGALPGCALGHLDADVIEERAHRWKHALPARHQRGHDAGAGRPIR